MVRFKYPSAGVKWVFGFLAVIILQITVLHHIAIIEVIPNIPVQPDIILLMLFFFGLRFPQNTTVVAGFLSGLAYDMQSGIMGLNAFANTIAGFLLGYFPRFHKIQKISQFILLLIFITFLHDLIYNAIYVFDTEIDYLSLVMRHTIPSTIYTMFVGVIVFYAVKK